jgi:uncharacterized protein YoxC
MAQAQLTIGLAVAAVICLAVVAISAVVLVVALVRLARDLRSLAGSADRSLRSVEEELGPAVHDLRETSANLRRLSEELSPRLERVDALLDESEGTLLALRATAEAAEDLVRGPAAAMDRARRTVRAAGEGLARGADRLRRNVEDATTRRDQR